jgi:hypothetical protein
MKTRQEPRVVHFVRIIAGAKLQYLVILSEIMSEMVSADIPPACWNEDFDQANK